MAEKELGDLMNPEKVPLLCALYIQSKEGGDVWVIAKNRYGYDIPINNRAFDLVCQQATVMAWVLNGTVDWNLGIAARRRLQELLNQIRSSHA